MSAQLRQRLAALLAGIAASLVGLSTARLLQENACVDAGGRWLPAARACEGAASALATSSMRAYALGAGAGLLTLVVLWRTFSFFASRRSRAVRR